MTLNQIQLIEDSWDYVLVHATDAGIIFYDRLFELNPDLRLLFKQDIKLQSKKLVSLITFVVHKLNNFSQVVSDIRELGVSHKKYFVEAEHYKYVGEALLWTLEKGLGQGWNAETKSAWTALYGKISGIMIDASSEARDLVA
jgi:nitric oxide dioxygenase